MSEVDHKSKLTVVETGGATFVRTRELVTAAQVSRPEGAKCAVLSLEGEGLALSIQLSAKALEALTNSGYWVLSLRPVEETSVAPLPPPAHVPMGVCG